MVEENIRPVPDPTVLTTAQLMREIHLLKELFEEMIRRVEDTVNLRFSERDIRFEQSARDSKLAIEAALLTTKEAVNKSESATEKQLSALNDKIDDIKARMIVIDGRNQSLEGQGIGAKTSINTIIQIVSSLASIGAIISVIILIVNRNK